jgi:hypothetical protein
MTVTVDQTETVQQKRLCYLRAKTAEERLNGALDFKLVFQIEVLDFIGVGKQDFVVTDRLCLHC